MFNRSGDVEEVYPDRYTNQFNLIQTSYIAESTVISTDSSNLTRTSTTSMMNVTLEISSIPMLGHLYHHEQTTQVNVISAKPMHHRSELIQWFINHITNFPTRRLITGFIIAISFLIFVVLIVVRLRCTSHHKTRKNLQCNYNQTNGKVYSQLYQHKKRYSLVTNGNHASKKRVPKFLRHLHTNEAKPTSFRLSSNSNCDNNHLIPSTNDNKSLPYRNSDCVLNEHCCIRSSSSQPMTSSTSMYHQINRLMLSNSDPPLPLTNVAQSHSSHPVSTATLRSLRKGMDNSRVQTYSAVYSCDLVANLDIEQNVVQRYSSRKRRSILKNTHSSLVQTKILFLYIKNLVDCYALQPSNRTNSEPIVLATADENRIQLSHALVSQCRHYFALLRNTFKFFHKKSI